KTTFLHVQRDTRKNVDLLCIALKRFVNVADLDQSQDYVTRSNRKGCLIGWWLVAGGWWLVAGG
ncbi:MAG: hypothetical protein H7Z74_08765, partial [Anaerolineae bacterium]|nr:hypothetical protein [Gemmatimonadaceae bacterium]